MPRVALLQNESEMRHNAYADARRPLAALEFEPDLFTAETVHDLAGRLRTGRFDALVVGSNALNDSTIRDVLRGGAFQDTLDAFLMSGRGLVCFHQMALAKGKSRLAMLVPPWDGVALDERPADQPDGIEFATGAAKHPVMRFPEVVEPARLVSHARGFTPLQESWFHCWTDVEQDAWTTLLVGHDKAGKERALVVVARDPAEGRRTALCALPADWHRPPGLLRNLLQFACRGSTPAAIVTTAEGPPGFKVVERWLESDRVPFERYGFDHAGELSRRIDDGVHDTVMLGPGVGMEDLDPDVRAAIEGRLDAGFLRVLGFGEPLVERRSLWVVSTRLSMADALNPLVAQAVAALDKGFVDGSFWRTVESLHVLASMNQDVVQVDADLAAMAIRKAVDEHMREDGSYDGTAAATCGLLYLLDQFGHERADCAADWLRRCGTRDSAADFPAEALAALTALCETGRADPDDARRLEALLEGLAEPKTLRELDLLTALHAAQVAGREEQEDELARTLISRVEDADGWIDLETAAMAVERLAALRRRRREPDAEIDGALVRAAVDIRHAAQLERQAPWAGRVGTSLMCMYAIGLVNEILDIPVSETVDALARGARAADVRAAGEAAAHVADGLRRSNDDLRAKRDRLASELTVRKDELLNAMRVAEEQQEETRKAEEATRVAHRWRTAFATAMLCFAYLALALLLSATGSRPGTIGDLLADFDDRLEVHLAAIALIVGAGVTVLVSRK